MKQGITRLATTVLVSGGLGLAGLGLAAGTAQATPGTHTWCPGQPLPQQMTSPATHPQQPSGPPVTWDMSVCHDWYWDISSPPGSPAATYVSDPVEGEYPTQLGLLP
ncbi:MAG: hypothetical protein QOD59_2105 [Mycobacterium sp.]|nr:hypothetical protein [Mycobacterium sp.]